MLTFKPRRVRCDKKAVGFREGSFDADEFVDSKKSMDLTKIASFLEACAFSSLR